MASTYSTSLKLTLIGDGDQSGIWGQTTNINLGTLLEQAITGVQSIVMADANYTLTNFNGVLDESRNAVLVVTGTNNAQRDLIPPVVKKLYTIVNNTTGGYAIRVIGATGTGVTIPNGATCPVYCDGTNFVSGLSGTSGNFTVNGVLSATNVSGNGATLTAINASNVSSGTIANARTTAATANVASTIVLRDSNGSFAGNVITGGSFSTTNFTITESAGVLQVKYGGTTVLSIDSTGNLISATNITAYGTP
jgi:hypothetical protein